MAHALCPLCFCVFGLSLFCSLLVFSVSARSCCRSSSDRRRSTLPFTSTPSAAQDDSAIPPGVFWLARRGHHAVSAAPPFLASPSSRRHALIATRPGVARAPAIPARPLPAIATAAAPASAP